MDINLLLYHILIKFVLKNITVDIPNLSDICFANINSHIITCGEKKNC